MEKPKHPTPSKVSPHCEALGRNALMCFVSTSRIFTFCVLIFFLRYSKHLQILKIRSSGWVQNRLRTDPAADFTANGAKITRRETESLPSFWLCCCCVRLSSSAPFTESGKLKWKSKDYCGASTLMTWSTSWVAVVMILQLRPKCVSIFTSWAIHRSFWCAVTWSFRLHFRLASYLLCLVSHGASIKYSPKLAPIKTR